MSKPNRDVFLRARVSPEEKNIINMKMEQTGIISLSAYLRKMTIDGYVVKLDMSEVREMVTFLRRYDSNLKQIARHADVEVMEDIMRRQKELWQCVNVILKKLASIA